MFGHDDQQQNNGDPTPDGALGAPVTPQADDAVSAPVVDNGMSSDSPDYIMTDPPQQPTTPTDNSTSGDGNQPASPAAPTQAEGGDLLNLKQQALQQLTPLLGHLDQSPEEKFRTTMMMIQASDNDNLLKEAYEAANSIPDEKARAQALLDVVNEINYFTQNSQN